LGRLYPRRSPQLGDATKRVTSRLSVVSSMNEWRGQAREATVVRHGDCPPWRTKLVD
jgi:hypothetical protein